VLAYLIFAHKGLEQVTRLVDRLATPKTRCFVHVDASVDLAAAGRDWQQMTERDGVQLVERHRCPWGGPGLVRATLGAMRAALTSGEPFHHLTVIGGQDYPIQPPGEILRFLDARRGSSFVEHFPLPRADWPADGGANRYRDLHIEVGGTRVHLPLSRLGLARKPPLSQVFQGGQSWTMSRRCAAYVVKFAAENPQVLRFFSRTASSDEMFFQSILLNSPLAGEVVNDDLRFERWERDSAHPAVLTVADLPELVASPKLFAKKFDVTVDREVLDGIDREILSVGGRP
jgi:hypothetical protein